VLLDKARFHSCIESDSNTDCEAVSTLCRRIEALAISVPAGETRVLKYFQERGPLRAGCSVGTAGRPARS
jgi:hypothetical protein